MSIVNVSDRGLRTFTPFPVGLTPAVKKLNEGDFTTLQLDLQAICSGSLLHLQPEFISLHLV